MLAILAGTLDKTVICLDEQERLHWRASVGNQAWQVKVSAGSEMIVAGTGSTRPWDLKGRGLYLFNRDGSLLWQQDLKASVWGLDLAADGQTIAAGTGRKELRLFDGQGHLLWQERFQSSRLPSIFGAAVSADGTLIAAAGGTTRQVRLFDRNGRQCKRAANKNLRYSLKIGIGLPSWLTPSITGFSMCCLSAPIRAYSPGSNSGSLSPSS